MLTGWGCELWGGGGGGQKASGLRTIGFDRGRPIAGSVPDLEWVGTPINIKIHNENIHHHYNAWCTTVHTITCMGMIINIFVNRIHFD